MNKEIAQYCMKAYSQYHNEMCEECPIYGRTGDDHCFEDALQYVINHFDVLDKIRAEIHANAEYHDDGDCYLRDEWIDEIFDKYKAESEE